jgi:hypothetical protein
MERTVTNTHPIEEARNPLLRPASVALQRAAIRARIVAAQTSTCLVISRNGVVELVDPGSPSPADHVHESPAPYTAEP